MMELNLAMIDDYLIPWSVKLVVALTIFIVGKYLAGAITQLAGKAMEKASMDSTLSKFLRNIINTILLVAVILAAIDSLGINITSLLAIVGAAGLAVGLALKDSLSNFSSGVMLIIFRPFKVGDFITTGGTSGIVDEIGIFCTLMRTGDNQRIIVPNSRIFGNTITNVSAMPTRRIDLVIGISYDDNIGLARDIIMNVLKTEELVLEDPAPAVTVAELADSSVNLNVRPWVNTADFWPVRSRLIERIKTELEAGGLSIPYPQRDVHIHNSK
jgi:small conductance mechanosensitive channel